jgi:hypothetical protein
MIALSLAACSSSTGPSGTSEPQNATTESRLSSSSTSASPRTNLVGLADSWIAYEGPVPGGIGNRMVRPDGTGDHWATPDAPVSQYHPDWSPDGQRIVFEADDPRHPGDSVNRDLWVSAADGGNLERVFDCELPCKGASNPAWSPDGQSLAFDVGDTKDNVDVNIRIAVLDLLTKAVRTVFVATGTDELLRPRWSPDGRTLVFETQRWTTAVQQAS